MAHTVQGVVLRAPTPLINLTSRAQGPWGSAHSPGCQLFNKQANKIEPTNQKKKQKITFPLSYLG